MGKLESMVLEAETVSALMIHLADDDVGDTSFAVMSDLGENGAEHECDLSVHKTALRASSIIDQLLSELEAKDKRIAELEAKLATPVRLPETYSPDPWMGPDPSGTWLDKGDVKEAIRAAGFTVGDE